MDYIICHYHEIALKRGNRKFFEERLVANIKKTLPREYFEFIKRISGRIIVKLTPEGRKKTKELREKIQDVFGIAYFAFAFVCEQEIDTIKKKSWEILNERNFQSFKIETKRSKKKFPLTSQEVNEKIGAFIVQKMKKEVNLEEPERTLFVEIVENYVFLYEEKIRAYGGLPVGTGGRGVVLLSGGIDSPVAAFLSMKRGIRVVFVHFHAHPYTDRASLDKTKRIIRLLNRFQFRSRLYLVPFAGIQKEILLNSPARLRVVLYRRFMFRLAERIAKEERASALITGESVGQVASQTLENMRVIGETVNLPILRPLVGQNKEEIVKKAKEIGTFRISILPHQDCCARFLPQHPETKANLREIKKTERGLNIEGLIEKSLEQMERILITT